MDQVKLIPMMPLCLYLANIADPPIHEGDSYEDHVAAWKEVMETFLDDYNGDICKAIEEDKNV